MLDCCSKCKIGGECGKVLGVDMPGCAHKNVVASDSTSNNTERDVISAICTRLENAFNDRDPESFGYAIIDLQKLSPVS